MDAGRAGAAGTAWVADSAEVTLRSASALADLALRSGDPALLRAARDLTEQAAIWLEIVGEEPGILEESDAAQAAAWVGRVAAGLTARLRSPPPGVPPEARRFATACLADLERHRAWAEEVVGCAERRGESARLHRLRAALPATSEFAGTRGPGRGRAGRPAPAPASRCPPAAGRASCPP